jgi:hypothetical protein
MSDTPVADEIRYPSLRPPSLPQASVIDGKLTIDFETISDGDPYIYVSVPEWQKVFQTDKMTAYVDNHASPIQFGYQSQPFYLLKVSIKNIANGPHLTWYKVEDKYYNINYSYPLQFSVINSKYTGYPAPSFPQSSIVDGVEVLEFENLEVTKGATIDIKYPLISEGDFVVVDWLGLSANNMFVPKTVYKSKLSISTKDVRNGMISTVIPLEYIEPINLNGMGIAIYNAYDGKMALKGISKPNHIRIVPQIIVPFNLESTQGAPVDNLTNPEWNSWVEATLSGPPGAEFKADLSSGASLLESPTLPYCSVIDAEGIARFRVRSTVSLVSITAMLTERPNISANTNAVFFPNPILSNGSLFSYNYTDNIPADGVVPSIITITADAEADIKILKFTVTGSALINRVYNSSTQITIGNDGKATVRVYNSIKEKVIVRIFSDNNNGALEASFNLNFK